MLAALAMIDSPAAELGRQAAPHQFEWEAIVYYTVTYDGVPIGATEIEGWGVLAGRLFALRAYAAFGLPRPARRVGIALVAAYWSRVPAATAARAWQAASAEMEALETRLGLLDVSGVAVPSPRISIIELPRRSPMAGTYVVADLGEAGAARGALRPSKPSQGADAFRPAA